MRNKTYVVGLPAPMPAGVETHVKTELERAEKSLKEWTMTDEERAAYGPPVPYNSRPKTYPRLRSELRDDA